MAQPPGITAQSATPRKLWQDRHMRPTIPQAFAALPDAITTAIFVTAWVAPSRLGPEWVRNLMLTMIIEFFVVHASGLSGGIASTDLSRLKRTALWALLGAAYMIFIVLFAYAFDSTWPIFAFGWLLLGRFAHLWSHPVENSADSQRMVMLWVESGITYIFGAILTSQIPLPALGLSPDFVASMHLTGGGARVERPQSVLAFGAIYFAVQAWLKYGMAKPAGTPAASGNRRAVSARRA